MLSRAFWPCIHSFFSLSPQFSLTFFLFFFFFFFFVEEFYKPSANHTLHFHPSHKNRNRKKKLRKKKNFDKPTQQPFSSTLCNSPKLQEFDQHNKERERGEREREGCKLIVVRKKKIMERLLNLWRHKLVFLRRRAAIVRAPPPPPPPPSTMAEANQRRSKLQVLLAFLLHPFFPQKVVRDQTQNENDLTLLPFFGPEMDMMKERFAKLLLGEDMSGGGKGVSSALALSNALTNLAGNLPFI